MYGEDGQIDIKKKNDILLGQVEELITTYGPLQSFGLTAESCVLNWEVRYSADCLQESHRI